MRFTRSPTVPNLSSVTDRRPGMPPELHRIKLRPGGGKPLRPHVAGVARQAVRHDAGRMPRCPVRHRPELPPFHAHFFYDPGEFAAARFPMLLIARRPEMAMPPSRHAWLRSP